MNTFGTFICLILLLHGCLAYSNFQDKIPNGYNVNHPCIPNYRWPGVGHKNRNGGGDRNVFGQQFAKEGFKWTYSLCQTDSDGDGRSNGQELGDPQCTWSLGQKPSRTENITHPGVCEPLNDTRCAGLNNFVSCQLETLDNCPVMNDPDVKTIDLRFPKFTVPSSETNYMCMTYDLPSDQDYHIVADKPIIDNNVVLHHMLLFGCDDANATAISSPQACGMGGSSCSSIIAGWTVGVSGECYGENVGFRFGATGYRRVKLQIHYNNPFLVSNYVDSSGIRLYHRPAKKGVQDLFNFMTGQVTLELPPGQSTVTQVGVCQGSCTSMLLNQPINVISALNHMHYLGRSMKIELFRNGYLIANLTNEDHYSYDSPLNFVYNPPIQILPGDEIRTTCVYNTMSSKRWVQYGEATSDEMCFGFLNVYPKSAINDPSGTCVAKSSLSYCDLRKGTPLNGCDWRTMLDPNNKETIQMATELNKNCNLDGFCRPECREVIETINSHPCFHNGTAQFVKSLMTNSKEGLEFLGRLQSCPDVQKQGCSTQCTKQCDERGPYAGAPSVYRWYSFLAAFMFSLTFVLSF